MKTVYLYNKTNEFTSTYEAQEDPLVKDAYITPLLSTTIAVPQVSLNEAAFFEQGQWVIKADFRGYVGYDSNGVAQTIDGVGQTPDSSWTLAQPILVSVPTSVSMRQARLALLANGQLATVQAALDALGDEASLIEWDFAQMVERNDALTQQMAGVLSLDNAALDALFIQAAVI